MSEKVACIAGTPVDTMMGATLLEKNGYEVYPFFSSKNPTEETLFQISSLAEKETKISNMLNEIKNQGIKKVMVYCNSLSSAVDFKKLSMDFGMKIITPFDIYVREAKKYNYIGVIAANAVATSKIEKVFLGENSNISIISVGALPLVWSIEKGLSPSEIISKHKLGNLCQWFEQNGVEALLLGCTHFSYLLDELKKEVKVNIIDPSDGMIELLKE